MGGGGCERHGEEESKNNKSNSVRDIQMLGDVERDRGVHRTWKSKDEKTGDAEVQIWQFFEFQMGGNEKNRPTERRGQ